MTSISAVARIAYLSSDVVLDYHPPLPSSSPFAAVYRDCSFSPNQPSLLPLPFGADPGAALLRYPSAGLISLTASTSLRFVTRVLPYMTQLSSLPVVLHISITGDLSDVLILRSVASFFIHSVTAQQAHDNALLASRLARTERKAVIHVFLAGTESEVFNEVTEDQIQPFLLAGKLKSTSTNGDVIGDANGNADGNGSATDVTDDSAVSKLLRDYETASLSTSALLRRSLHRATPYGSNEPNTVVFTLGATSLGDIDVDGLSIVEISLVKPLPSSFILTFIPESVTRVIVLEQVHRWTMKWTPLFLEVVSALQQWEPENRPIVQAGTLGDPNTFTSTDVLKLIQKAPTSPLSTRLQLGVALHPETPAPSIPYVPKHESAYTKILSDLFSSRLEVSNSPLLVSTHGEMATTPEFALGRVRVQTERRDELVRAVQELVQSKDVSPELHDLLGKWILSKGDGTKSRELGEQITTFLESSDIVHSHPAIKRILSLRAHFPAVSRWIIGSDAWSYDLGASGLHHLIASGLDVNILILDTTPYSQRASADPHRRKQDAGLYAMNRADVYVASIAVYSSYSQALQALLEADRFPGPSVILAYLPYKTEDDPALHVLKETKLAVDAGYWPLYRWDPSKEREGKEPFVLDSDAIKHDLQEFLDRQNHLAQLVRSKPEFATELVSSLGENIKEARKARAQQVYDQLLSSMDGLSLLVLYASDGGTAEKFAKRLTNRGKLRGLSTTLATMDSVSWADLAQEEYIVFITSTAGQGEPPQNGRKFFKTAKAAALHGEQPFEKMRFSVFAMGDSHYWPRPEDSHYYNKPGKELDACLEQLGGQRVADLGLGDDQDADGPETGYKIWEPLVWKALGVEAVEVTEAEPDPITNEHIKIASNYLRGTIVEGLEDNSTGNLAPSDTQLTKFHGIYEQDDRDIRDERLAQGLPPAYAFMVRVRMPGGVCRPEQWLAMDQIADEHGSGTFKITTRQTFQFHGVVKRHLKRTIQSINRALLDTLAACGDVNRNVLCSAIPGLSKLHAQVYQFAKSLSDHLLPRTTAYHEIWLDKKLVAGEALKDFEPLYGEFYLPRKFKIAVAVPPTNDVDIFTNDVGFIAIVDEAGHLAGFNVTAGGGMGVTHGNKKTYPRLGDIIGFCTIEQGKKVAESIMLVQRDNGNRADRKNARLKYTIDRIGLDNFKAEVERRLGWSLSPARPFSFDRNVDDFGWTTGENGKHHFTLFIENGRVQDEPDRSFKSGLREIARVHKGTFRMTANQHMVVADVASEDLPEIQRLLSKYKLDNLSHTALRLSSSACVAFPTCGLAMAESERYLPVLIDKVEKICEENGLRNDSIVMRMTGCPNGCARPYVAEVAFVGKSIGTYAMLLGGGYHGQRLNKIYRESVTEPEILAILRPMIRRYALERLEGERFGDFVIRAGYISPTTSGKEWYQGMGGEGLYREAGM